MTMPRMSLVFTVAKTFEEKLVDTLLANETAASAGFSTRDVSVYGANITYRTSMERVHGRVRGVEVCLVLDAAEAASLLAVVQQALPGRGVVYRLNAISESGEL